MTTFPEIHLTYDGTRYDWYRLVQPCWVQEIGLTIPKGFQSDMASSPQVLWGIIPPHCRAGRAAIPHDFLYENQHLHSLTRKQVDALFLKHLTEHHIPRWQRLTMYYYVRMVGWYNWKKLQTPNHDEKAN